MQIKVRTVDGSVVVDSDVSSDMTVGGLKELCAKKIVFPPIFQTIIVGEGTPSDAAELNTLWPADVAESSATLILALNVMETGDDQTRFDAHEALATMIELQKANQGILESTMTVAQCSLKDPEPSSRRLAIRVLGDMATNGDKQVTDAAVICLADKDPQVVAAALDVLGKIAPPGDDEATPAIVDCMKRASMEYGEEVCFAAVRALGAISVKGDKRFSEAFAWSLQDGNSYLRLMCLDLIGVLSQPGDETALAAVHSCMKDSDPGIREKACVQFLLLIEPGGDLTPLIEAAQDGSIRVRTRAFMSLEKVAPEGIKAVGAAVIAHVADPDENVRCVAVEVLGKIANKGDMDALEAARSRMDDEDQDVKDAADEAIKALRATD